MYMGRNWIKIDNAFIQYQISNVDIWCLSKNWLVKNIIMWQGFILQIFTTPHSKETDSIFSPTEN